MKRIVAVVLALVLTVPGVAPVCSAIPPWYLGEQHPEGVDENDPRYAYDAYGARYAINVIYVYFHIKDFEKAKRYFTALRDDAKSLPGVEDVTGFRFDCHPVGGGDYSIRVALEAPEDYHISFGDLDADGLLTAADARACLRIAVGLNATRYYWTTVEMERRLAAQNAFAP